MLNHSAFLFLARIRPPDPSLNIPDFPFWIGSRKGDYSVSTTYNNLLSLGRLELENTLWKIIWKWEGPHRICYFLWLVAHGKILTNFERFRRHI